MKTPKLIISAITACLAIGTTRAAKLCTGEPIVWATGISLSSTSGTISVGSNTQITATVAPTSPKPATDRTVIWSTSNGGVASVSGSGPDNATGTITAFGAGTATITAMTSPSATANGAQFTATYAVTVPVPYSIHPNLTSVCVLDSGGFPANNCNGGNSLACNWGGSGPVVWQYSSCPPPSPVTMYGNSRCSTQSTPYKIAGVPAGNGSGSYCWCQLCSNINRTTCGAWVLRAGHPDAGNCNVCCAMVCGPYSDQDTTLEFRIALCTLP